MRFIDNPNLPNGKVKVVLISEKTNGDIKTELRKRGIDVIEVKSSSQLSKEVSSHADMQFHHLGKNVLVYNKNYNIEQLQPIINLGAKLLSSEKELSAEYPNDIILNCARVGNKLFCSSKYVDSTIKNYCKNNDIHIIDVKQGYSKCSICVVDESSIITADSSIAKAAKDNGIDVLKIASGSIELKGYNTGFIGGCCGKLDANTIMFCGDIKNHPDYKKIKKFLEARNIKIDVLGKENLVDVGSIIPICEE